MHTWIPFARGAEPLLHRLRYGFRLTSDINGQARSLHSVSKAFLVRNLGSLNILSLAAESVTRTPTVTRSGLRLLSKVATVIATY